MIGIDLAGGLASGRLRSAAEVDQAKAVTNQKVLFHTGVRTPARRSAGAGGPGGQRRRDAGPDRQHQVERDARHGSR